MVSFRSIVLVTVAIAVMFLLPVKFKIASITVFRTRIPAKDYIGRETYNDGDIGLRMVRYQTDQRVVTAERKGNKTGLKRPVIFRRNNKYIPLVQASVKNITAKSKLCNKSKTTHIVFLKVPRSGSTTLENILYRFSKRHNLTIVLPKKGVNSDINDEGTLQVKTGDHWDILVTDAVFDREKFSRVLPKDVKKVSIIRDPLKRMISAAYYYRDVLKSPYLLNVPRKNFIVNLIRNNSIYEKSIFSNTKNSMAKSFGFPPSSTKMMSKFISDYISKLPIDINLVLDVEHFDESLVLMKRYFGWDLNDILYIPANTHGHEAVLLSAGDVAKFKSISFLDYAIYEEFSKILQRKIMAEDMEDEVVYFKVLLNSVRDFCSSNNGSDFLQVQVSKWNCPFILTSLDCHYIKMDPRVISTHRHKKYTY